MYDQQNEFRFPICREHQRAFLKLTSLDLQLLINSAKLPERLCWRYTWLVEITKKILTSCDSTCSPLVRHGSFQSRLIVVIGVPFAIPSSFHRAMTLKGSLLRFHSNNATRPEDNLPDLTCEPIPVFSSDYWMKAWRGTRSKLLICLLHGRNDHC